MENKIIIAENHTLTREGLISVLSSIENCKVVGSAKNAHELNELLKTVQPSLIVVNPALPDLSSIESISELPVLIVSNKNLFVKEAFRAGAKGYLHKNTEKEEIVFAVKSILKGLVYISPDATDLLMRDNELSALSKRELEVLKLLSEGIPNRDVAKLLHISNRTIDSHRSNIMKKLGAKSNADLVQIALKNGLIE